MYRNAVGCGRRVHAGNSVWMWLLKEDVKSNSGWFNKKFTGCVALQVVSIFDMVHSWPGSVLLLCFASFYSHFWKVLLIAEPQLGLIGWLCRCGIEFCTFKLKSMNQSDKGASYWENDLTAKRIFWEPCDEACKDHMPGSHSPTMYLAGPLRSRRLPECHSGMAKKKRKKREAKKSFKNKWQQSSTNFPIVLIACQVNIKRAL